MVAYSADRWDGWQVAARAGRRVVPWDHLWVRRRVEKWGQ